MPSRMKVACIGRERLSAGVSGRKRQRTMPDKFDELATRFRLGADSATRARARAKEQADPDGVEALDFQQRMARMGAPCSIETALQMVKERKSNANSNS